MTAVVELIRIKKARTEERVQNCNEFFCTSKFYSERFDLKS